MSIQKLKKKFILVFNRGRNRWNVFWNGSSECCNLLWPENHLETRPELKRRQTRARRSRLWTTTAAAATSSDKKFCPNSNGLGKAEFGRRLKLRPRLAEFLERAAEHRGRLGIVLRRESRIDRTLPRRMKVRKFFNQILFFKECGT